MTNDLNNHIYNFNFYDFEAPSQMEIPVIDYTSQFFLSSLQTHPVPFNPHAEQEVKTVKKRKINPPEHDGQSSGLLKNLKDLEKSLLNTDFNSAEKIYSQIPVENKKNILDYLQKRHALCPFTEQLDLVNIDQIIPLDALPISTYDFLQNYMLPALQQYLAETFEVEKISSLFKAANECKDYIEKYVVLSGNHPNRHDVIFHYLDSKEKELGLFDLDKELADLDGTICLSQESRLKQLEEKYIEINEKLTSLRNQNRHFYQNSPKKTKLFAWISMHQMFKNYHIGNCGEISAAGFHFLSKKHPYRVEIFKFKNKPPFSGDHVFVVLNRKKGSDPANFKTWGRKCLIVDNWKGKKEEIFYAHEIPIYLEDYLEVDFDTFLPITEKFNPQKHLPSRVATSRFSTADLIALSVQHADQTAINCFAELLTEFEKETSPEKKQVIAQGIIANKFQFNEEVNHHLIRELKMQMRLFLNPYYLKVYQLSAQPLKGLSAFEALKTPDVDFSESFISHLLIDHLCRIAALLQADEGKAAHQKLSKLHEDLLISLSTCLLENFGCEDVLNFDLKGFAILQPGFSNEQKAISIYSFIQEKIKMALTAGREKTAYQLLSLLPQEIQEKITKNIHT